MWRTGMRISHIRSAPSSSLTRPRYNTIHSLMFMKYRVGRAGLLFAALMSVAAAQDFDVLIVNGRIVDGTGNPSFLGDVGIRGGRIAEVGRLAGRTASRTIDAKGL